MHSKLSQIVITVLIIALSMVLIGVASSAEVQYKDKIYINDGQPVHVRMPMPTPDGIGQPALMTASYTTSVSNTDLGETVFIAWKDSSDIYVDSTVHLMAIYFYYNGTPIVGANVEYEITTDSGEIIFLYNTTDPNGFASVEYVPRESGWDDVMVSVDDYSKPVFIYVDPFKTSYKSYVGALNSTKDVAFTLLDKDLKPIEQLINFNFGTINDVITPINGTITHSINVSDELTKIYLNGSYVGDVTPIDYHITVYPGYVETLPGKKIPYIMRVYDINSTPIKNLNYTVYVDWWDYNNNVHLEPTLFNVSANKFGLSEFEITVPNDATSGRVHVIEQDDFTNINSFDSTNSVGYIWNDYKTDGNSDSGVTGGFHFNLEMDDFVYHNESVTLNVQLYNSSSNKYYSNVPVFIFNNASSVKLVTDSNGMATTTFSVPTKIGDNLFYAVTNIPEEGGVLWNKDYYYSMPAFPNIDLTLDSNKMDISVEMRNNSAKPIKSPALFEFMKVYGEFDEKISDDILSKHIEPANGTYTEQVELTKYGQYTGIIDFDSLLIYETIFYTPFEYTSNLANSYTCGQDYQITVNLKKNGVPLTSANVYLASYYYDMSFENDFYWNNITSVDQYGNAVLTLKTPYNKNLGKVLIGVATDEETYGIIDKWVSLIPASTTAADLSPAVLSRSTYVVNDSVSVPIRIYNHGNLASSATIASISMNGKFLENIAVPEVPVGEYCTVYLHKTLNESFMGLNQLSITVDPNNAVAEFDETNNAASVSIRVIDYSLELISGWAPSVVDLSNTFSPYLSFDTNYNGPVNATIELPDGLSTSEPFTKTISSFDGRNNWIHWRIKADDIGTHTYNITISAHNKTITKTYSVSIYTQNVLIKYSNSTVLNNTMDILNYEVFDVTSYETSGEVYLSAGSMGRMIDGLEYLVGYPHGCAEQTTSPMLASLYVKQYYKTNNHDYSTFANRAQSGVDILTTGHNAQRPDGGWGMWSRSETTPWFTAYSFYALTEVNSDEDYGYMVNAEFLNNASGWLVNNQNSDGYWDARGSDYVGDRNTLTAFITLALENALPYVDTNTHDVSQNAINNSILYLLDQQNSDGGWGAAPGDSSNAYTTSHVLIALNFSDSVDFVTTDAIINGTGWLVSNQNTDGSWSQYPSHAYSSYSSTGAYAESTAYALWALHLNGYDQSIEVNKGVNYLTSIREFYGGFGSTRSTAAAVRALTLFTELDTGAVELQIVIDNDAANKTTFKLNDTMSQIKVGIPDSKLGKGVHELNITSSGDGRVFANVIISQLAPKHEAIEKVPLRYIDPLATPDQFSLSLNMPETVENGATVKVDSIVTNGNQTNDLLNMLVTVYLTDNITFSNSSSDIISNVTWSYNETVNELYLYPEVIEKGSFGTYSFNVSVNGVGDNTLYTQTAPMYNPSLIAQANDTINVVGTGKINLDILDEVGNPVNASVFIDGIEIENNTQSVSMSIGQGSRELSIKRDGMIASISTIKVDSGISKNYTASLYGNADEPRVVLNQTKTTIIDVNSITGYTTVTLDGVGITTIAVKTPAGYDLNNVISNDVDKVASTDVNGVSYATVDLVGEATIKFSFGLKEVGDDSPSTTSGGGSGSGGGGSGSTGELFENIAIKDVVRMYVTKDTTVTYRFKEDGNSIEYVKFDAKTNAGYQNILVEVLRATSALAIGAPHGKVYQNMNIWVGKGGYANDANIENSIIGFKVARSWILENDIDISTITLDRYNSDMWNRLQTRKTGEDSSYIYFESVTPGFSPFAITGEKKSALKDVTSFKSNPTLENEMPDQSATPSPVADDKSGKWSSILMLVGIIGVGSITFVKRNKINSWIKQGRL